MNTNISISPPEKAWLNYLYENFKKGKRGKYREGIIELGKKIPNDFDPKTIDSRLIRYDAEEITLLGILTIDPDTDIIPRVDKVITTIQNLLLQDIDREKVSSEEIATILGIPKTEASLLLRLAFQFNGFFRSASSDENGLYNTIDLGGDEVFNKYRQFNSIKNLIQYQLENTKQIKGQIPDSVVETTNLLDGEIIIKPHFKSRILQINERMCFIIMPFKEEWSNRVFNKHLRPSIESLGLQCLRSDMRNGQVVIEDIWTSICQASFLIADVTGQNPNVMYELGIAHTLGKPVLMLTQNLEKIPFDMRHLRHEEYEYSMDGLDDLNGKLIEKIKGFHLEHFPESTIFNL